jgi:hypothetical protein
VTQIITSRLSGIGSIATLPISSPADSGASRPGGRSFTWSLSTTFSPKVFERRILNCVL